MPSVYGAFGRIPVPTGPTGFQAFAESRRNFREWGFRSLFGFLQVKQNFFASFVRGWLAGSIPQGSQAQQVGVSREG